jgi:hypothetical protein
LNIEHIFEFKAEFKMSVAPETGAQGILLVFKKKRGPKIAFHCPFNMCMNETCFFFQYLQKNKLLDTPTNPGQTNPGQTNPGHDKPWTGQTLDRTNPGQDKPWTGPTLDRTNPGQTNRGQTNPGQTNHGHDKP